MLLSQIISIPFSGKFFKCTTKSVVFFQEEDPPLALKTPGAPVQVMICSCF